MSRLAELIEELCPDGVEYRPLGEIADLQRGSGMPKKLFVDEGIPAIHYGHIFMKYGIHTKCAAAYLAPEDADKLTRVYPGDLVVANTSENLEDVGKGVVWLGEVEGVTGGHATVVRSKTVDSVFLSYFLRTEDFALKKRKYSQGTKVVELSAVNLSKIDIPVPPLVVQREIVRILDQFTTLEAELEAELEARRAQYEHYRNHLLSMTVLKQRCGEIAVRKLGDVGVFHGGLTGKTKADFVDSPDASAFVTYKEIYSRIEIDSIPVGRVQVADKEKQLALQYGDVLFTGSSESSEEVGMTAVVTSEFSERVYLNSFSICFRWSEELFDPGYAKHMFNSPEIRREIQRCASGVTRFNLSKKRMEKISVPVPPLEVQHEIMRVLDDFDALVNDISSGLPAEIAARRAQYEHYRDRLLSFPEKVVSVSDVS